MELLDKEVIEKLNNLKPLKVDFFIGIDTYESDKNAFVFMRKVGDNAEVILAKTIKNKKSFKEEVDNLAKYFNATLVETK